MYEGTYPRTTQKRVLSGWHDVTLTQSVGLDGGFMAVSWRFHGSYTIKPGSDIVQAGPSSDASHGEEDTEVCARLCQ